jgi:hypothetical protein
MKDHIYPHGLWWWRCLNCGERIDGAILRHRAEQDADEAFRRQSYDRDLREWSLWFRRLPGAVQPV